MKKKKNLSKSKLAMHKLMEEHDWYFKSFTDVLGVCRVCGEKKQLGEDLDTKFQRYAKLVGSEWQTEGTEAAVSTSYVVDDSGAYAIDPSSAYYATITTSGTDVNLKYGAQE